MVKQPDKQHQFAGCFPKPQTRFLIVPKMSVNRCQRKSVQCKQEVLVVLASPEITLDAVSVLSWHLSVDLLHTYAL